MLDWTSGYVADINYTYGYYQELNPLRAGLALLQAGLAVPEIRTACELGFGQGVSANLHAAASGVDWYGTDFNPSQACFARELASISGARVFDQSFEEFLARDDLPGFDFIGLHGIWSWISAANREIVVEFVRRRLNVGGVLYISYNALPGWATAAPLRHLMCEHRAAMGGAGTVNQIEGALAFTERVVAANPVWARANPQIPERLKLLKSQGREYLAHEYFNRDWQPMFFSELARHLHPAKLSFAASANYVDFVDALNLTAEQQALVKEASDVVFRETVRDYMLNQQFRRDFWIRGARRLDPVKRIEALRRQAVVLTTRSKDVPLKVKGVLGEANLVQAVYEPIIAELGDHRPRSLGDLETRLAARGVNLGQILEAALVLIGQGHAEVAQDAQSAGKAKTRAQALNLRLLDMARGSADVPYLASPISGGGVIVPRIQQLFLLASRQGRSAPEDWVAFAWQALSSLGQRVIKDGTALASPEENIAELKENAQTFAEERLPILKALEVV